jgi:ATP-dependent Clp protease adaptor protein ClpS
MSERESSSEHASTVTVAAKPRDPKPLDLWHVILLDDDHHTYDYVIRMMQQIFHCDQSRAFTLAKTVDEEGRVICATLHKELAELKQQQIHAFGKDTLIASCTGAMSAVLEPAP